MMKKFHISCSSFVQLVAPWIVGVCEALLVARLLARMLAARPDNPLVQGLYALSRPLVQPLMFLDGAQPRFGAVLELSTLTAAIIVPLVSYLVWLVVHPVKAVPATSGKQPSSKGY